MTKLVNIFSDGGNFYVLQEGPPLVEDYSIEAEEAQESTSSSDRETSSIDSATQKDVKEPSSSVSF